MKVFGLGSVCHPRLKYPKVTSGSKVTLDNEFLETSNNVKEAFNLIHDEDWINIVCEDIKETDDLFRYNTKNRGIDLIFLPTDNMLKITVRYSKLKGNNNIVRKLIKSYINEEETVKSFRLK